MRRVIINADDFGLNKYVDDNIIEFVEKNLISSTTILANGLDFDRAVEYAKSNDKISYGVHLNLTQSKSLTSPKIFSEIGLMISDSYTALFDYKMTNELSNAVELEWSAQIEKCLDSGVPISHLDSHHHVHTNPALFLIVKRLSQKYDIRKIRNTYNLSIDFSFLKSMKKKLWSFALKNYIGARTTDYFLSYTQYVNFPKLPESGLFEIMCHPGGYCPEEDVMMRNLCIKKTGLYDVINYNDI